MHAPFVRRDMPETMFPTATDLISNTPGENWAFGSYSVLSAALPYDVVTAFLQCSMQLGITATADVTSGFGYNATVHLARGAAGVEKEFLRTGVCQNAHFAITGLGGGESVICRSHEYVSKPLAPMLLPGGQRIAYRAASSENTTATQAIAAALGAYEASLLYDRHYRLDTLDQYDVYANPSRIWDPTPIDIAVVPGATNVYGVYADIDTRLDNDYLFEGFTCSALALSSYTLEFALGRENGEKAQARGALRRFGSGLSGGDCTWRDPFIAFRGERLSVRIKRHGGFGGTERIIVNGRKLGGKL